MDTSRIEELLEQLIDKQDELIGRIESLEASIELQLTQANSDLTEINGHLSIIEDELNWSGESPSLAKMVLSSLASIETEVGDH